MFLYLRSQRLFSLHLLSLYDFALIDDASLVGLVRPCTIKIISFRLQYILLETLISINYTNDLSY
jgi:hypothetical protein